MSSYYYDVPGNSIRVYWSTKPKFSCDNCGHQITYKSWVSDSNTQEQKTEQLDDYNKRIKSKHVKRKITKTNVLNHDIGCYWCKEGSIQFLGWSVWVIDADKRKEKDIGGLFKQVEDDGELERHLTETVQERKDLVNELYEKYKEQ